MHAEIDRADISGKERVMKCIMNTDDDIVKGFRLECTPAEILIINKSLMAMTHSDFHKDDKSKALSMIQDINNVIERRTDEGNE